jgi:hypothetical protein
MEDQMHAVLVFVTIQDFETARKGLQENVVPAVTRAPGFIAGYWTRSEDGANGKAMILFDSQESAEAASGPIRAGATDGVTVEDIEVREVVAHANQPESDEAQQI